jgi:hypothetical protein
MDKQMISFYPATTGGGIACVDLFTFLPCAPIIGIHL